eukprot:CAMPEP_0206609430 /NCGR_PEP_ID=MMETSP0325_2-20121206/53781_1 /ASSEMBLY_ACC=CAM_ASM_000347 /TAXON_ID=2866 /ORGANISM="Crypthecodinium cohnii, Strain Seligo" /LENGTH=66 /DNA_ID=CAMNT_0054127713 /DNA_START=781 /DNA_END=979 /DNA_ORIENTATION=-
MCEDFATPKSFSSSSPAGRGAAEAWRTRAWVWREVGGDDEADDDETVCPATAKEVEDSLGGHVGDA